MEVEEGGWQSLNYDCMITRVNTVTRDMFDLTQVGELSHVNPAF